MSALFCFISHIHSRMHESALGQNWLFSKGRVEWHGAIFTFTQNLVPPDDTLCLQLCCGQSIWQGQIANIDKVSFYTDRWPHHPLLNAMLYHNVDPFGCNLVKLKWIIIYRCQADTLSNLIEQRKICWRNWFDKFSSTGLENIGVGMFSLATFCKLKDY